MRYDLLATGTILAALAGFGLAGAMSEATGAGGSAPVALVLDASGSMAAPLGSETRLAAAKRAAGNVIDALAPETPLVVLAYGHRSERSERNCRDIESIVPLAPAGAVGSRARAAIDGLAARGYTPISDALEAAAEAVPAGSGARIVLVSDGKETCSGDPCATARAIATASATLVIHVVGLGVDSTTRSQLRCIAEVARGRYFDASDAGGLSAAMTEAVESGAVQPVKLALSRPGRIVVTAPDGGQVSDGYRVIEAETGREAGFVNGSDPLPLAAGIYTVAFGTMAWKGVLVRPGEDTRLDPGVIRVEPAGDTHLLLDRETGEEAARLEGSRGSRAVALPGGYDLGFCGGAMTMPVEAEPGRETVVRASRIVIEGGFDGFLPLYDGNGRKVCEFFDGFGENGPARTVVPGSYTLDYLGQKLSFDVVAGQTVSVALR